MGPPRLRGPEEGAGPLGSAVATGALSERALWSIACRVLLAEPDGAWLELAAGAAALCFRCASPAAVAPHLISWLLPSTRPVTAPCMLNPGSGRSGHRAARASAMAAAASADHCCSCCCWLTGALSGLPPAAGLSPASQPTPLLGLPASAPPDDCRLRNAGRSAEMSTVGRSAPCGVLLEAAAALALVGEGGGANASTACCCARSSTSCCTEAPRACTACSKLAAGAVPGLWLPGACPAGACCGLTAGSLPSSGRVGNWACPRGTERRPLVLLLLRRRVGLLELRHPGGCWPAWG